MRRHDKMFSILIVSLLLLSGILLITHIIKADSSDVYVDDDADPGWYDATHVHTIQEGINNASAGDTVYVSAGIYQEDVVINKSLTLQGAGRNNTTIKWSSADDVVQIASSDVVIDGFTINGSASAYDCIGVEGDDVYNDLTVTNNHLTHSTDSALYFAIGWNKSSHTYPTDMGSGFTVNDNLVSYFSDSSGDAGLYFMYAMDIEAKRNTIGPSNDRPSRSLDYGGTGIYMMDYCYGTIENNIIDKVYGAIMLNSAINPSVVKDNVITDSIYGILMTETFEQLTFQDNIITVRRDPQTPDYADPRGITLGGDGDYYDSSPPLDWEVDNLMHIITGNNITFTGDTPAETKGIWVVPGMIDRDYGASGNITNNVISGFGSGLKITGKSGGVDLTDHVNVVFKYNTIINCIDDATASDWTGADKGIDVKYNWWGNATGPSSISAKYNFLPYYADEDMNMLGGTQDALDNMGDGEILVLENGTVEDDLNITANITIKGDSPDNTIIEGSVTMSGNVNMSNLSVMDEIHVSDGATCTFSFVRCPDWHLGNLTNVTCTVNSNNCIFQGISNNISRLFYCSWEHTYGTGNRHLIEKDMGITVNAGCYAYINITEWTEDTVRKWTATSTGDTVLSHRISGLKPTTLYNVAVNGQKNAYKTDANGEIEFVYSGSWSIHTFAVYPVGVVGWAYSQERDGDSDGDGLSDDTEAIIGTDPHLPDTDFDGHTDYEEYLAGTDPLDYNDHPGMRCWLCIPFLFIPLILWIFIIIPAIIAFLAILLYCRQQKKKKRKKCCIKLLLALLLLKIMGVILYLLLC